MPGGDLDGWPGPVRAVAAWLAGAGAAQRRRVLADCDPATLALLAELLDLVRRDVVGSRR